MEQPGAIQRPPVPRWLAFCAHDWSGHKYQGLGSMQRGDRGHLARRQLLSQIESRIISEVQKSKQLNPEETAL